MHTLSTAFKNLKNNFSFYALYLLSVAFVVTIFFAFTSFSMNKVMLEKISNDGRVETMCNTISVFLMAFVVFYMSYSNRFFLRRRTKELGIYALLGYRKSTILSLLTTENLLTCTGAFIAGILLGSFFHKGIVFGITKLLDLAVNNSEIPFFNPNAIMKTACFIFTVIIVLALSNSRFLFKTSLMDLVRYEKSAEKKMKFHAVLSVIGFLAVISGYSLALDILRGSESLWITVGFYPVAMPTFALILSGTVLFIASFLPFVVQAGKKNKRKFYTETKIITAPAFIYRIRSNSRTLIMLTLLSAAALTVSSVMALSLYYPIAAVSRMAPSEIECRIETENEITAIKQIVSTYSSDADVTFLQTDIYKVASSGGHLPMEYSIGTSKGDADNEKILREAGFECIPYSAYKALLEAQGRTKVLEHLASLNKDECILIKYQPDPDNNETDSVYPLLIGNEEIPVIAGVNVPGLECIQIFQEQEDSTKKLLEHLSGMGYRDVALLGGYFNIRTTEKRREEILENADNYGIKIRREIIDSDYSVEGGNIAMQEMLKCDKLPQAIICINDLVAIGVLSEANKNNLKVPGDIAIVGYDNLDISKFVYPGITTIASNYKAYARAIVDTIKNIEHTDLSARIAIPTELIIRGTTRV